jgi:hypothetical protein
MADSASIQRPSPAHNENPIRKVDNSDQPPQWAIPNVKNKLPASTESDKAGSQLPLKRKKPTTQQVLKMVVLVLVCYPVGLILGLIMIKISMLLGIFP